MLFRSLAKADPGNAEWRRDVAVSHAKLATVFLKSGDKAKAREALGTGREIMAQLTQLSADNAIWRNDLAWFDGQIAALSE